MNNDRQRIKELLNQDNEHPVSAEEAEAVTRILSVLKAEDDSIRLTEGFSETVVQRMIKKQARENRFGWLGYFLGIFGLIVCLVISLVAVDFTPDFGFLKNMSHYSGLFIFGTAFILILNLLEKKIFRVSSE